MTETGRRILEALSADPRRSVYVGEGGLEWWIDWQGGGPFLGRDVHALRDAGLLTSTFPDTNAAKLGYVITDAGRQALEPEPPSGGHPV